MTVGEKKAISRQAIEAIYSKRNAEAVNDIYASDYVLHGPFTDPGLRGPEGVQRYVKASRETFQEVDISVEDQIVEGDKVVTRWKARIIPQKRGSRRSPYRSRGYGNRHPHRPHLRR